MKRLRPNFQRSNRIGAFLTVVAGIFLFTPAINAGVLPSPPSWIRYEFAAVNLYESAMNQENSGNMAGAVKTLRQARQDSTTAITDGGGTSPAVLHNDQIIGEALMMALLDAAKPPANNNSAENQTSGSNTQKTDTKTQVKPVVYYAKTSIRQR